MVRVARQAHRTALVARRAFFVVYNYIAYLFGMPFHVFYLPYLIIVTLSVYTIIALVASIDADAVRQQLSGVVPNRVTGGVLAGLAILLILRAIGVMVTALISDTPGAPPRSPRSDRRRLRQRGLGFRRDVALAARPARIRDRPGAAVPRQHALCWVDSISAHPAAHDRRAIQFG